MARLLCVATVAGTVRSFLLPLADHFRAQGWQVDTLAQGAPAVPECCRHFDRCFDIAWSRNPLHLANLGASVRRVRQVVAEGGYDLVHVHTPVAAFVTRLALRQERLLPGGPRVIYTAHGFHFHRGGGLVRNALFAGLERLAGRWTDHLVVINREDEQAARRLRLVPDGRLHYMPGIGVDLQAYSPDTVPAFEVARVRREMGLAPGTPLFLMVAAFDPGKRHRDMLHALARLGRPEVHLACAGIGPLEPAMRALAARLGLGDRVHLLGFRRDIPALVRASVATVLPSEREGLPRSVMESLCLETPVIGTAIRGVADLLAGGGGLLVPVGAPAALAGAMARLLDGPAEAARMGARGRRQMEAYEERRILALHQELYAAALGMGGGAGALGHAPGALARSGDAPKVEAAP